MVKRPNPDKDKIKRKERDLYSRSYTNEEAGTRQGLSEKEYDVNDDWDHVHEKADAARNDPQSTSDSFFNKLFIFSLIFFIIAVGLAGFLFYSGSLTVSDEKVAVVVEAPDSVRAGEEVALNTLVTNNNDVALNNVTLTAHYPSSARDPEDPSEIKQRDELSLNTIEPGQQVRSSFNTSFFGSKGATSTVTFVLQYNIEGSNATLDTRKEHVVGLNSAPVTVSLDAPSEVNANEEMSFDLNISSNTSAPINDLMLEVQYPQAFSFVEADPEPGEDRRIWDLGTLGPDEERTVTITGVMTAAINESRTFRFTTGRGSAGKEQDFDLVFDEQKETVTIKEPHIGLETSFNGEPADTFVGEVGESVQPSVVMTNNLPVRVTQPELRMSFSGNVFRRKNVDVRHTGFYQSSENAAVWNNGTDDALSTLISDQEYNAVASVMTPQGDELEGVVNPHLDVDVEAQATQREDAALPQTVTASRQYRVKMNTQLALDTATLYGTGPFETSGPIPPVADQRTTYTIKMIAGNRFNDVEDAEVFATLPPYVRWADQTTSDAITYDQASRTITWDIGDLPRRTGAGRPPEEAAFQLVFQPSLSQVDGTPQLLENVGIRGEDTYTNRQVRSDTRAPTIDITHLEEYDGEDSVVQED